MGRVTGRLMDGSSEKQEKVTKPYDMNLKVSGVSISQWGDLG